MKAALVNRYLASRYFNDVWMVELHTSRKSTIILNIESDDFIKLLITDCLVTQALPKLVPV